MKKKKEKNDKNDNKKRREPWKWPNLSGLTELEYSTVRNMILLVVCHTPVCNFNTIFGGWWLFERQHNHLKCLSDDFCNYYRLFHYNHLDFFFFSCMKNYSSCLILQFRTEEQFLLTALEICQKTHLAKKDCLIYSVTGFTEFS